MTNQTHEISVEDIENSIAAAAKHGCSYEIHVEDFIYQFLVNNPVFDQRSHAISYYFDDARNSANSLKSLAEEVGIDTNKKFRLLEFASGYGCVSRHLSSVMPKIDLVCSDIHKEAMEFIGNKFGLKTAISNSVPENFKVKGRFDIVFALSFFSHMPESTWFRWLEVLFSKVAPGGSLIFTTQGLTSRRFMGDPEIPKDGFWFKAESEQKDLDVTEYGQTVVTRDFVNRQVRKLKNASVEIHSPAYWWGHQDLWVIQKKK